MSDTQRAAPDASGVPFAGIADQAARARVRPGEALFDEGESARVLPVCDHYCGVEARMRKSLELQAELGPVFDVTLDCEDGAPVGGEREHALLMAELVNVAATTASAASACACIRSTIRPSAKW